VAYRLVAFLQLVEPRKGLVLFIKVVGKWQKLKHCRFDIGF
jgi:hypothetical protein